METPELLKLISLWLQYPDKEIYNLDWKQDITSVQMPTIRENLEIFARYFHDNSLDILQENYVQTFDFNDKANLYLTYYKSGEEKERGNILAELKEIYSFAGLEIESSELPDYLPLLLEFISCTDEKIHFDLLNRFRDPIHKIQTVLSEQNSPYAALLKGLVLIIDHLTKKEVLL